MKDENEQFTRRKRRGRPAKERKDTKRGYSITDKRREGKDRWIE
jgi:hypothetical protein